MSEVSSGRRRLGIVAITTTALALPLTASITYAQAEAPAASEAEEQVIETIDPSEERRVVRIERRMQDGENAEMDGEHERQVEVHVVHGDEAGEDGERRIIRRRIHRNGEDMSEAELEEMMAELEREFESVEGEIETAIELAMTASEHAMERMEHRIVMSDGEAGRHNIQISCDGDEPVVERQLEDGRRATVICRAAIRAQAAEGLREAREEIRNNPDIPENLREEILRSLERSMERMSHNQQRMQHIQAKAQARIQAVPATRASTVAMRWQGRMVSPVQVVVPAAPAAPRAPAAPTVEADCDETVATA